MVDEETYEVLKFLGAIPDPRIDRCKKYSMESILFTALVGMLCGADSARKIVEFGDANESWIKNMSNFQMVFHHTIRSIEFLALLKRMYFARCSPSGQWTQALQIRTTGEEKKEHKVIAIDGKSLCGRLVAA